MLSRQTSRDDEGRRGSVDGKQLKKGSPFGDMLEAVRVKAQSMDLWNEDMQRDLPKRWEKHGDMIIFPQASFTHQNWRYVGRDLWRVVAESLKVARLGRKRVIDERTPHVDLLYGSDGWVEHDDERRIRYIYDASKRVFNIDKAKEMKRVSEMDCHGETVVDMYAGLGYFTFPFAIACGAKKVYAIDWDEDTIEALVRSRSANQVDDTVEIVQGDSRRGVADRVYLGLVPSCHAHLLTASKSLSPDGGIVHVQEAIDTKEHRKIPTRKPLLKQTTRLESVDEAAPSTSGGEKKEETVKKTVKKVIKKKAVKKETNGTVEHPEEAKENKKVNGEEKEPSVWVEDEGGEVDEEGRPKLRRKFSRSASIVEEYENRVLPDPTIHPEFAEAWRLLLPQHREFAMECGKSMTKFLNNIHESDAVYFVTIVSLLRLSSNKSTDIVVLDLVCAKDQSTASRLSNKLLPKDSEPAKK